VSNLQQKHHDCGGGKTENFSRNISQVRTKTSLVGCCWFDDGLKKKLLSELEVLEC